MASLLLAAAAAPPLLSRLPSTSPKASSFFFSFSHSEAFGSPLFAPVASLSTSASSSSYPSPIPSVYCGRGDRKTAKGKRFNHSYGNARRHGKNKGRGPLRPYAPPAPLKKDRFEDNEIVKIEIDED